MASRPQVISPSRPHATIGKVPPPPRVSNVGRSGPRTTSSMPPVPKVILAWPGREQPCPMSDACWSPAIPAIGGAPSRAVAGAIDARRVDHGGQDGLGDAQGLQHLGRPTLAVAGPQPGDGGVGGVGDVDGALGQVPGDPRVDGAEAQVPAAIRVGLVEEVARPWWPRGWGRGGCPRPAAPGSHRRCAGPASPVRGRRARPWPGPTRWWRPAGWRCPRPPRARRRPRPGGHSRGPRRPSPGRRTRPGRPSVSRGGWPGGARRRWWRRGARPRRGRCWSRRR